LDRTATVAVVSRPELFGALLCRIPIIDMLRFDRSASGKTWIGEFGNPNDAGDRAVLETYSPLLQIRREVVYPPTFIVVGAKDDRVHPSHGQKLAAVLQERGLGGPFLLRTEEAQGHGGTGSTSRNTQQEAEMLAFALEAVRGR
jgi:prolyl oligopeptidase